MGAFIRQIYVENPPEFSFVGETFPVTLVIDIDDIFTTETSVYVFKVINTSGNFQWEIEAINPLGKSNSQKQWKLKVDAQAVIHGLQMLDITVGLYRRNKTTMKDMWIDSDTTSFIIKGITFQDLVPPFEPAHPLIIPEAQKKKDTKGKAAFWITMPTLLTILPLFRRRRRED